MPSARYPEHSTSERPRPRTRRDSTGVTKSSHRDRPREHHRDRDRERDHHRDHDRDHHSRDSRHSSQSTSSHRHRSPSTRTTSKSDTLNPKLKQAMQSALTAGAVEAIRVRNKSGHWVGAKGVKVATAALGAAVIENTANKNPDENARKKVAGGTVGGLVMGQLIDKLK